MRLQGSRAALKSVPLDARYFVIRLQESQIHGQIGCCRLIVL